MRFTTRRLAIPLLLTVALVAAGCDILGGGGDTLTGKTWQWVAAETTLPASISNVPDPEDYTIAFNEDGTFSAKVDCNQVSGAYTSSDDGSLTITPGPSTMAACGDDSLDQLFLAALSSTTAYRIDAGQLVLITTNGSITLA